MTHTPSATSPYRLHVRDIVRRPGSHREFASDFAVPMRLGNELIGIPAGAAAALQVQCEVVTDGMWVSGTFTARAEGECGRCLDDVAIDVDVAVQGLYLYPDVSYGEGGEAEDVYSFDGITIDLEGVVTDAVVTALPFTPLCDEGCRGLCDQCGAPLAEDPDHAHEILDPRWSALQSVKDSIPLSVKEES